MDDSDIINNIIEYLKSNNMIDIYTTIVINGLNNTDNNRRKISGLFKKIDLEYENIELKKIKSKYYLINKEFIKEKQNDITANIYDTGYISISDIKKLNENIKLYITKRIEKIEFINEDYNEAILCDNIAYVYRKGILKELIVLKEDKFKIDGSVDLITLFSNLKSSNNEYRRIKIIKNKIQNIL